MLKPLIYWMLLTFVFVAPAASDQVSGRYNANRSQANSIDQDVRTQTRRFNLKKYWSMTNPKEAAEAMIRDAEANGIDVDRTPQNWFEPTPVVFKSGERNPEVDNGAFLQRVAQGSVPTLVGKSDAICFFQYQRTMSVREWSTILSLGVKVYSTLIGRCFIARVPVSQIKALTEQPAIGWCGFYLPEYKYDHNLPTDEVISFIVESLAGRSTEFASDLSHLGVDVETSWPGGYLVKMSTSVVDSVAQLWWVREIYPEPGEVPDSQSSIPTINSPSG
jgi:hypothetical protein